MKHRLYRGISFFLTAIAFLTVHLVIGGTASTAAAQYRPATSVSLPPSSVRAAEVAEQFPGEQHPKLKPHHETEKTPAKRAQLCKKLELRRAELRAQSEEKQKKAMANSDSVSGK